MQHPLLTPLHSGANATAKTSAAANVAFASLSAVTSVFGSPKLRDLLQLAVVGVFAEITRRYAKYAIGLIEPLFCFKSTHACTDDSYEWLLAFWLNQPSWEKRARFCELEASKASACARAYPMARMDKQRKSGRTRIGDKHEEPEVRMLPFQNQSHIFWYQGVLVWMQRYYDPEARSLLTCERMVVRTFTWRKSFIMNILAEGKRLYIQEENEKINIKMLDDTKAGTWQNVALKAKRSLDSVAATPGLKEMLVKECEQFLNSQDWCRDRGIPWRKGFLFEGVPGSGKTSLIHALASHLDMDVYFVSLATSGLTDSMLNRCLTSVPSGAIVVMEDIDVGIPSDTATSLSREDKDEDENTRAKDKKRGNSGGGITLSGLLNAIDGVAGSEGRILFMTTNNKSALDPALIRAGRADVCIEFKNACRTLGKELFRIFYPLDGNFPTESARRESNGEKIAQPLDSDTIEALAEQWVSFFDEHEFSSAALQGMLMRHKDYPGEAVDAMPAWVAERRAEKARDEERKRQAEMEKRAKQQGTDSQAAEQGVQTPALPMSPASAKSQLSGQE